MLKISAFLFNTNVDLHESSMTFSCWNIISRQWWSNLIRFMNENLFNVKIYYLKFHHIIHNTNSSMHQQVPCTCKKMISLGSRLIACCKLAPTLARHMRRHNYVIDRNEYLIFTLSQCVNPWVYSLQFYFLFKSTDNSWRYERKCEWVFFSEHSV